MGYHHGEDRVAAFSRSPKNLRRLVKAVNRARRDGLFKAVDEGVPVIIRARVTDGLQDKLLELFSNGGFHAVAVDARVSGAGDFDGEGLRDPSLSVVVYGLGDGRVGGDVMESIGRLVHDRCDGVVGGDGVSKAMTVVIVHDSDSVLDMGRYDDGDLVP